MSTDNANINTDFPDYEADTIYLPGITIHKGHSDYAAIRDGKMYGVQVGSESWKVVHAMIEDNPNDPDIANAIIRLADDIAEGYGGTCPR